MAGPTEVLTLQGLLAWMRSRGIRINLRPLGEIQFLAWLVLALIILRYLLQLLGSLVILLLQALFSRQQAGSTSIVPVDSAQQELTHIEQQLSQFRVH